MAKAALDNSFSEALTDKTLLNMLKTFTKTPDSVVFMTDSEGNYVYLDGQGLAYLNIVPEEWIGRSIFDFLKDLPEHQETVRKALGGQVFFDTSQFGEHYFEDRLFPVIGAGDKILGIAGIQVNITDKIIAERKLQSNTELLNNLFDSIPDNAYILDENYNVLRINAAVKKMFPELPMIGSPCYKTVHGLDSPCAFCPVVETFQTGLPVTREYYDEQYSGYYELTSFPIYDQKTGKIVGATELARNITDRKRMEDSLLRNEALLNDLLEILDEGVYLIDTNYTITRANKAFCDMYPDLNPLVGKKCYDTTRYHSVCPDCATECMFRDGKSTSRTFYEKNSEDEPGVWLELTVFPLYEQGNTVSGAICIVRDVTPRIELESQLDEYRRQIQRMAEMQMDELRVSEAKLRSVLETCGAAITFADHLGRFTYVNGKFKEMFGYSTEELRGKDVNLVMSSDRAHAQESSALIEKILRGEIENFRRTFELSRKSGEPVWADTSVSMIRGSREEDSQLISVILDVTAQQQLLEQLSRAKIAAEDASLAKSQFLATMSHEIRTPLNGVIGVSSLLMSTPLQPKQLEYAKLINASGESLLTLINDILDFSKIEAGKFELGETEFIIHELLESVSRILTSRTLEKNLEFVITFDARVPGPVIGDEGRLRQVLLNLAGNALKFTETGGVRIHVDLKEIQERHIVLKFDVIDTGIGIPKDRQDRLFQQFVQIDSSSSRTYGGTGLGLAISKKLLELMDGSIHLESEPGRGSDFSFTVRLKCIPLVLKCMRAEEYPCITEKRDYCRGNPPTRCARSGRDVSYLQKVVELHGTKTLLLGTGRIAIPAIIEQMQIWGIPVENLPNSVDALPLMQKMADENRPYRLLIVDFSPNDPGIETLIRDIQDDERLENTIIIGMTPLSEDWKLRPWKKTENIRFISKPICCSILLDCMVGLFFRISTERVSQGKTAVPDDTAAPGRVLKVLVAEDNRINQIVVSEILQNAGIETVLVVNGQEALEKAEKERFDVILMDCQMPVMDGYTATGRIRKLETDSGQPPMPIIALTANATSVDEAKCIAAGMDAYCSKPINADELITTINHWVGKGSRTRDS